MNFLYEFLLQKLSECSIEVSCNIVGNMFYCKICGIFIVRPDEIWKFENWKFNNLFYNKTQEKLKQLNAVGPNPKKSGQIQKKVSSFGLLKIGLGRGEDPSGYIHEC